MYATGMEPFIFKLENCANYAENEHKFYSDFA